MCEKSVETGSDGFACDACWRKTHIFCGREIICRKCSAFLKNGIPDAQTFCHRCEADGYDLARAVGLYQKALSVSILTLKHEPFIPKRLQNLLLSAFENSPFQDTSANNSRSAFQTPFAERGYNQAALIAKIVAKQNNLPIEESSLVRTIHTDKHRAGMDRKARLESVKNAFEVKRPRLIEGENILLVDDVFTSGATVSNCAKILKKNGAAKVYVLTIARAF